jgi:hypothetical protein
MASSMSCMTSWSFAGTNRHVKRMIRVFKNPQRGLTSKCRSQRFEQREFRKNDTNSNTYYEGAGKKYPLIHKGKIRGCPHP